MPEKQRLEAALPTPEAADLTVLAAKAGVPLDEFLGVQVLAGAYGSRHPEVVKASLTWPTVGHGGPRRATVGHAGTGSGEKDGDNATKSY